MAYGQRPAIRFGPFVLDVSEQTLARDGRPVPLTPKLFDVLRLLVENQGHLVDKETFIEKVWDGGFVEEGALTRTVSQLRKALGDTQSDPVYIETVPKRGYRFIAPVTTRPARAGDIGTALAAAGLVIAVLAVITFALRGPERGAADSTAAPVHAQVTFTGTASAPAISRDGQRIAYIASDDSGRRALVRDFTGGDAATVFRAPELGYPRWSPDDRHLLIWARGAGKAGVYVVSRNGTAPREIAPNRYVACWSPDGSLIAVPHYLGGEIALWTVRGEQHRVLSLAGAHGSISDLDWSGPAGRLAVASHDFQGRYSIWTIRPDGSDQDQVVEEAGEITTVRWAPDGDALYYSHRRNQTVAIKRVMLKPGGVADGPAAIITGLEAGREFSISGDGTRVVYARAPFHSNLWRIDLDQGGGTSELPARALTSGTSYIDRPRVSPDGTQVAFTVGHEPDIQLYTMPLTAGPWRPLTDLESTNIGPAWSPDGTEIAFVSMRGQKPQVWTVAAGGGVPRRRSAAPVSDSCDLSWSRAGIAFQNPGNRNYTVLNPDTGDEHALVVESANRWISSPVVNSVGDVAVFWNRQQRGIWVIDAGSGRERLIHTSAAGSIYPIGWSSANDFVYVVEGEPATLREMTSRHGETMKHASILRVPAGGGDPQIVARLAFAEIGMVAITPDARSLVVPVFSSRSDIWLVDDFDPSRAIKKVLARRHLN